MTRADPSRFRADIQGLRAIAVGLVLLYHAGVPGVPGGYVGVDVFFVISGFLISSHLLETIERDGRISFAQFYARRARRILPASFVVAGLTAVAVVAFFPPLGVERVLRDGLATVLYVPNIWFAAQNTDYLADHSPSPYQHYWSLGVEEQFYLLWPLILLLLALIVRRRRALVAGGIAVIAALSLAACIIMTQAQQPLAFFLLPTRAWELLAGALVGAAVLGRVPRMKPWVAAAGGVDRGGDDRRRGGALQRRDAVPRLRCAAAGGGNRGGHLLRHRETGRRAGSSALGRADAIHRTHLALALPRALAAPGRAPGRGRIRSPVRTLGHGAPGHRRRGSARLSALSVRRRTPAFACPAGSGGARG